MFYEAINDVLFLNNTALNKVIEQVKEESIDDTELILQLSIIKARSEVLQIFTENLDDHYELKEDEYIVVPPEPVPAFLADVANDDPAQEDKDEKKARQENRSFYG